MAARCVRDRPRRVEATDAARHRLLEHEKRRRTTPNRDLRRFRERVTANGAALMTLLRDCKAQGKRVVGYGATSKSTTTINFCGITPDLVEFISDTTPAKQGRSPPARTSRSGLTRSSRPAIRNGRCCSPGTTPPKCARRKRRSPAAAANGSSTCQTFRKCDGQRRSGTLVPA